MEAQHAPDFGEFASVQIVSGEDGSVLRRHLAKNFIERFVDAHVNRHVRLLPRRLEGDAVFFLFFQADQTLLRAIAIHELLREHGSQPSIQRPTSRVRGQLRSPHTFALTQAVKFGVDGVRQLAAARIITGNRTACVVKLLAKTCEEQIPRFLPAGGASAGQRQIRHSQVAVQLSRVIYAGIGPQILLANVYQDLAKFGGSEAKPLRPAGSEKVGKLNFQRGNPLPPRRDLGATAHSFGGIVHLPLQEGQSPPFFSRKSSPARSRSSEGVPGWRNSKGTHMKTQLMLCLAGMLFFASALPAGQIERRYKVLSPISHGNLTVFPVVATSIHDASQFLTLDEGIRSGEVVVTESGNVAPLIRRRGPYAAPHGGPQVNTLVLINNSKRPLLLLAGEIVTGGKQDRVIGKDRIVPAESDPIDLGVFCVEPGRWVAHSEKFGTISGLAQPSVRAKAMAEKDQQKVWDQVAESRNAMIAAAPPPPMGTPISDRTTSYAMTVESAEIKKQLDEVVVPVEQSYTQLMHQLRDRNAVGVVVAVNGEIIWADIFASPSLLEKYWSKLVRSYAAEAMVEHANGRHVTEAAAEAFLENLQGNHEVVDTEAGLFREAEISGSNYKVFQLTSLLPNTGFDVHVAKMTTSDATVSMRRIRPE